MGCGWTMGNGWAGLAGDAPVETERVAKEGGFPSGECRWAEMYKLDWTDLDQMGKNGQNGSRDDGSGMSLGLGQVNECTFPLSLTCMKYTEVQVG